MSAFHQFQSVVGSETIERTYLISFVLIEITANRMVWILFGCALPQVFFLLFIPNKLLPNLKSSAFHQFQSVVGPETIKFNYSMPFVSIEVTANQLGSILFGCASPQVLFYYFSLFFPKSNCQIWKRRHFINFNRLLDLKRSNLVIQYRLHR